jgi:hypothetical protein
MVRRVLGLPVPGPGLGERIERRQWGQRRRNHSLGLELRGALQLGVDGQLGRRFGVELRFPFRRLGLQGGRRLGVDWIGLELRLRPELLVELRLRLARRRRVGVGLRFGIELGLVGQ